MNKIYLTDQIFYIENFLSDESHGIINKICEAHKNDFKFRDQQRDYLIVDTDNNEYKNAFNEMYRNLELIFNNEIHSLIESNTIYRFNRYEEDQGHHKEILFGAHSDDYGAKQEHGLSNSLEPIIFFGCIYYINDDYDGGEINYPNQNISIKPKANSLLCHSGGDEYVHEVRQIFNSEKYSMPFFIKNNKFIDFN